MTENTNKSVFIKGNKELFLSKGAIQRFKNDLKKCDIKNINIEDGKYLTPGYIFNINFKDNNFYANIITQEEYLHNEKRKMLKSKLKKARYNRSVTVKKERESLRRSIPDKLFKSYMNLMKQGNFGNIPSPKDVIDNPEKFEKQISLIMGENGMVSNDGNANNAIKKYFNSLGNFMGVEPSQLNINKTQSVQQTNNASLVEEVDTEDEEEPELVNAN
tara:strand:- start:6822 stop:7472 length:651 start_codon:yes stop_codon:yes gene_type:complete